MPSPKYPGRKTTAKAAQTSATASTRAGYSPTQGTTQAFTAAPQQPVYDYAATQGPHGFNGRAAEACLWRLCSAPGRRTGRYGHCTGPILLPAARA